MIATAFADGDDADAERAVATTESALVVLDPELAAAGITPAIRAPECRVSNEDQIREPAELEAARKLRSLLADLDAARGGGPAARADRGDRRRTPSCSPRSRSG